MKLTAITLAAAIIADGTNCRVISAESIHPTGGRPRAGDRSPAKRKKGAALPPLKNFSVNLG